MKKILFFLILITIQGLSQNMIKPIGKLTPLTTEEIDALNFKKDSSNMANPNDWNNEEFWGNFQILEMAISSEQYTDVIKWSNAGLKSPNLKYSYKMLFYYSKGIVKFQLKDYTGSLSDMKKYTDYALIKFKLFDGKYILNEDLNLEKYTYWPFVFLTQCYLVLNKNTEAIENTNSLLSLKTKKEIENKVSPNTISRNGDIYFMRAYAYIQSKNFTKACSDLSIAGDLGINKAYETIQKYCNQ